MPQKLKPAVRKKARTLTPSTLLPGRLYSAEAISPTRPTFKNVPATPP